MAVAEEEEVEVPAPEEVPEVLRPLWAKVISLQDMVRDINTRLIEMEHFTARLALPAEVMPRLTEYFPRGSRWVLEIFPDEVAQWREAVAGIPREGLTEKERGFLRSLDYYIVSERRLTLPQLAWLSGIIGRVGDHLPEIPLRAEGEHHSSPPVEECRVCGYPIPEGWKECPQCGTSIYYYPRRSE